jgi:Bardet-Biedl syndrome 1 protein
MYRIFNRDFTRIKYRVATEYFDIIKEKAAPLQYSNTNKLQINAVVNGLGPKFKIVLTLSNVSATPMYNLTTVAEFNNKIYVLKDLTKLVRSLVPKMDYSYNILVDTLCNTTSEEMIKITIVALGKNTPIANVMVQMPVSENFIENF